MNSSRSKAQADTQRKTDYVRDSVVIGSAQCQADVHEVAEGAAEGIYLALCADGSSSVEVNRPGFVMVLTRKH